MSNNGCLGIHDESNKMVYAAIHKDKACIAIVARNPKGEMTFSWIELIYNHEPPNSGSKSSSTCSIQSNKKFVCCFFLSNKSFFYFLFIYLFIFNKEQQ